VTLDGSVPRTLASRVAISCLLERDSRCIVPRFDRSPINNSLRAIESALDVIMHHRRYISHRECRIGLPGKILSLSLSLSLCRFLGSSFRDFIYKREISPGMNHPIFFNSDLSNAFNESKRSNRDTVNICPRY